jgi:fucose 4-O-acetylase-like acetyltransferase
MSSRRDPWLDNTKMFLVTAVVVGHSWRLLEPTTGERWIYDFLYFWHVPAFVLVSGYLSRSFEWDGKHLLSVVTTLIVPYLIFEPALYYFRHALGQVETGNVLLIPHWTMWYLPVLAMWRLATPILRLHWVFLPLSVVVSAVGGLWSGQILCVARAMGLLPFFVLGLFISRGALAELQRTWIKPFAVAALLGILLLARDTDEWARTAFLYYDAGYDDLGWSTLPAMKVRLVVIAIGLLGSVSVLALVPRRGGWFSAMGAATMVVYLFHGFVISAAEYAGWAAWADDHVRVAPLVTTVAAVALALGLASAPVRRPLTWAVDPIGSWQRRRTRVRRTGDDGPAPANDGPPSARPERLGPDPRR